MEPIPKHTRHLAAESNEHVARFRTDGFAFRKLPVGRYLRFVLVWNWLDAIITFQVLIPLGLPVGQEWLMSVGIFAETYWKDWSRKVVLLGYKVSELLFSLAHQRMQ